MNNSPMNYTGGYYTGQQESLNQYTVKTFLWMVLGLGITFAVAVVSWITGFTVLTLRAIPFIHVVSLVATLVISFFMASRIEKMKTGTAVACFVAFSAIFGFTLSIYLLLFNVSSVIMVFLGTAVYFGVLAAYGHFTKRDLTSMQPILFTGLIFLIIYAVIALFIAPLPLIDTVVSIIGIAVFLGYTAYDTQQIKRYYHYYAGFPDVLARASIFSALQLYLDFINLFLYLIRFIGVSRDN